MNPTLDALTAAQEALDAYENRFESTAGNFHGPIDEEMKVLRAALAAVPSPAVGDASTQSTHPADVSKNSDEFDTIEKLSAIQAATP